MNKYKALTKKGATAYLQVLEEIDWFDKANDDKTNVIARLEELSNLPNSDNDYAYALKSWLLDYEDYEFDDDSKTELFREACTIAGLEFVSVEFEDLDEEINVKLTTNKGTNEYEVSADFMYQAPLLMEEVMNHILAEDGNYFLMILAEDQTVHYAFITLDLYFEAVEKGVIPEYEDYIEHLDNNYG